MTLLSIRKTVRLKKVIESNFLDRISPKKGMPLMNSNTLYVPS